jgi:signal recognition particle subunit SRP54
MQRALGGGPAATPSAPAGSAFGVAPKKDAAPDLSNIELPPGLEKFLGR